MEDNGTVWPSPVATHRVNLWIDASTPEGAAAIANAITDVAIKLARVAGGSVSGYCGPDVYVDNAPVTLEEDNDG